jgi:hypothetical protein
VVATAALAANARPGSVAQAAAATPAPSTDRLVNRLATPTLPR